MKLAKNEIEIFSGKSLRRELAVLIFYFVSFFNMSAQIQPIIPNSYDDLMADPIAGTLDIPSNIRAVTSFDATGGQYVITMYVGEQPFGVPFRLTPAQYNAWQNRLAMQRNLRRISMRNFRDTTSSPLDFLDWNYRISPLERVFGKGGVKLSARGNVEVKTGVTTTKTDNPALALKSRRKSFFDFDPRVQANITASVGSKLKFELNYNTDAAFDFDSKNIRLAFDGDEDDIVKSIEAGNVSLSTGSSLIRGSTSLFGVKTKLQFGRLSAMALVAQQNSVTRSASTRGGVQTIPFQLQADDYDENANFFLAHYFRDNYDQFASNLPYVSSGIQIKRIEVWVTNRTNNYNNSRNIVAFADIGESEYVARPWLSNQSIPNPDNRSNNLLQTIITNYPDARNINNVTQVLAPLSDDGLIGGRDYEKIESARLLDQSEYYFNPTLGYISLISPLTADMALGVAFEYTFNGQVYQVGEFSTDVQDADKSLFVKMLRPTSLSPQMVTWRLMMKNVYSLGSAGLDRGAFKLDIKYLSDTTGTLIPYLPTPKLSQQTLLSVMNLDRLDRNNELNPDGFFDFIEGYTILSGQGKIVFPVVEPFGNHLANVIDNDNVASRYIYQQLYDSTLVVARQYAEQNRFVLSGEYSASTGTTIRLNASNIPRGSVVVTAGGVTLTENSDYIVDYALGSVTIINKSIADSGQDINVTLEDRSVLSTRRKTLAAVDLQYQLSRGLNIGGTVVHFSENSFNDKVYIGNELVNNTMAGLNVAYNTQLPWLDKALTAIPTVNSSVPSMFNFKAEYARLIPSSQKSGSLKGSSYIDDFESAQSGIDLRSPHLWALASTPYDDSSNALFPEATLSDNPDYGKNRALLNWYYIDRLFTYRNSSICPAYLRGDVAQQSNPYVREITTREIFPGRDLAYGESSTIQTLNLSFYPTERGPYNVDDTNIDADGNLLNPERRWGGIMTKMDMADFRQANVEYIQFWLLNPFLDSENDNRAGGDLYFNLGDISEDILKDGMKSYENGIPYNGDDQYLTTTSWGRVSRQNSLTYAFDNETGSRLKQDVGLDGLANSDEFDFSTYKNYLGKFKSKLSPEAVARMESDKFSPLNDPAGDNYHFYLGEDYDRDKVSILDRYKRYNGVEGNSLSPDDADDPRYQSAKNGPDIEDINVDNTLNEYERYYQYHISVRPEDLVVGKNYITDRQTSVVTTRSGEPLEVEWFQFKIPLTDYEKVVGAMPDLSSIRFARIFLTGFSRPTHLRFATLELIRGQWRTYDYNIDNKGDIPADGELDVTTVNIEENSGREPVNYVLPPGVNRMVDNGQSQSVYLNEQSMSMKVVGLPAKNARGVYKTMSLDLRNYKSLQMFTHCESLIDDMTDLTDGQLSVFIRLGSDLRQNYYEYEVPLTITQPGHYNDEIIADRYAVWPEKNVIDIALDNLVKIKENRNRLTSAGAANLSFMQPYSESAPDNINNRMTVIGNPSLGDIRVMMIGVRNNTENTKDGIVWVNELRVTGYDATGGWAGTADMNLSVSDIASFNFGGRIESAGFGDVDMPLAGRRLEDYCFYNFAMKLDAGRFLPESLKLQAPIYYSLTRERTTPQYNPLDTDVKLKDALDAAPDRAMRDSIKNMAVENLAAQNFSVSGFRFNRTSERPMPWDPANFTANVSFSKQSKHNPTTEYENTNEYRGGIVYQYNSGFASVRPFARLSHNNFIRDWEINWFPTSIGFRTDISRYYYEQQVRSTEGTTLKLPVSVNKNFLWDRQLTLSWDITRSLSVSFMSMTTARIDETQGAVNRKLFPEQYKQWKDTVIKSLLSMGTPLGYNQSFTASYRLPFAQTKVLNFITAAVTYNVTYRWDKGASLPDVELGNNIFNQATFSIDGRVSFEDLYNKSTLLKSVSRRFGANSRRAVRQPIRSYRRTIKLSPDTTVTVVHNLRTQNVRLKAFDSAGNQVNLQSSPDGINRLVIESRADSIVNIEITPIENNQYTLKNNIRDYALRLMMTPRHAVVRWRRMSGLSLPLFRNNIGNIFGQAQRYGAISPGLGFAFGFVTEDYVAKAKSRGWLVTDNGMSTPAIWSTTDELNLELNLEPIRGFRVRLVMNRTDNRNSSIQFTSENFHPLRSGTFTMTSSAISTALSTSSFKNGYESKAFERMLSNIHEIEQRQLARYSDISYPNSGFIAGNTISGKPFYSDVSGFNKNSSDILIPAFVSAYTGIGVSKVTLNPFPKFNAVIPNWSVSYDGLSFLEPIRRLFKSIVLNHVYQCTYSVGSYSSFPQWVEAGNNIGFIPAGDGVTPVPSSPYNIMSVAITERFAPLLGLKVVMHNNLSLNAEYRDRRTLTLNTAASQVVEATQKGFSFGAGYKIVGLNLFYRHRKRQSSFSNDMNLNADFSFQNSQALVRRIETVYTQATSGARIITMNLAANYALSRLATIGLFVDHQINTPIVAMYTFPTTTTSYGLTLNLSLMR